MLASLEAYAHGEIEDRLHFQYEAERVTADERVFHKDLSPQLV